MPDKQNIDQNVTYKRPLTSDQTLIQLAKRIAFAYSSSRVRLLSAAELRKATALRDIDAINKIIAKVPQMSENQRKDFCDAFVGEDLAGLDLATPMILAEAYRSVCHRVNEGEKNQKDRLSKIERRIDDLSADFANSGGMVVSAREWPLVNISNIADVYEGFGAMLDERLAVINRNENREKVAEMLKNKEQIDIVVSDYDNAWNLKIEDLKKQLDKKNIKPDDAKKLVKRWDKVWEKLKDLELSEETLQRFSKYKFLDKNGKVIPQFMSGKRGDKEKYEEYQKGFKVAKDGRLASVIELARHDLAKKLIMDYGASLEKKSLEKALNEEVVFKLFEICSSDQVIRESAENPDGLAEPQYREEFFEKFKDVKDVGAKISDDGYNAAIDEQTNATAGWAARIKSKLERRESEVGGFWNKIFSPIRDIDKLADIRLSRRAIDKREKRIELILRMLKGFGSAFVVSILFTLILSAVAAATGAAASIAAVNVAKIMAVAGTIMSATFIGANIIRWRRTQKDAGLPTDIFEFFRDRRLWLSILTSLVAIGAMCFGAGGLTELARKLGIGALGIGAYNNLDSSYVDARDAKMSKVESFALGLLNAGFVIGGAFTGRWAAHGISQWINETWSRSNWFQKQKLETDFQETTRSVPHSKTVTHYPDEMLQSAERAVKHWYQQQYPNDWEQHLQQDIKAVEQYNADTGSDANPFRILRAIEQAGPRHLSYTDAWGNAHGVTPERIDMAANALNPDGTYNLQGMKEASNLDLHHLGTKGKVGEVPGHVIKGPGDVYNKIDALPQQTTESWNEEIVEKKPYEFIRRIPVEKQSGLLTPGNYNPRVRKTQLGMRLGSFIRRVQDGLHNNSQLTNDENDLKVTATNLNRDSGDLIQTDREDTTAPLMQQEAPDFVPPRLDTTEDTQEEDLVNKSWFTPVPDSNDATVQVTDGDGTENVVLENIDLQEPMFTPLPEVREEPEISEQDKVHVLPTLDNVLIKPQEPESILGLTYSQAKKWDDLNENLKRVQSKRHGSALGSSEAAKLLVEEKDILHDIERLYNQFGRPSPTELKYALADIYRREYERHMKEEPMNGRYSSEFNRWMKKYNLLLKRLEEYGIAEPVDESRLYPPVSVRGVQAQKQAEREAARAAAIRAEQERREAEIRRQKTLDAAVDAAESLEKVDVNHFVPTALRIASKNTDLTSKPLTLIGNVKTKLVDLTGQGNPVTQNANRAMVVVDIDGFRLPFYLANGTEPGHKEIPGKWYPMFSFTTEGDWFFVRTKDYLEARRKGRLSEIEEIADALNERIGDIRNYRDPNLTAAYGKSGDNNFIGGVDAVKHLDPIDIYNIVDHDAKRITSHSVWGRYGGNTSLSMDPIDLEWYVEKIKKIDDQQKRGGFFREIFEGGLGNIADKARKRIRQRFGRSNYYEYE